jgi:ABC-type Zn uptake system ZnuABC Zn-binding protein ZnuA
MRQTIAVLIVYYGQRPVQSRIVLLCGAIAMLALSGCGGSEPSGSARTDDRTVVAAFYPLVSPDLATTVAREAGATTAVLDPVEGLEPAAADAGADYFTVMRKNLAALRKALECT